MPRVRHPYLTSEFEHSLELTHDPNDLVPVPKVPDGYVLRLLTMSDSGRYLELIHLAWPPNEFDLHSTIECSLPGGFFVIEHLASGRLVATAMAGQGPPHVVRNQGRIWMGWVVTDPDHTRLGLGKAVVASATNALVNHGHPRMYVGSDDDRLVAISMYLNLGWEPLMRANCMPRRWNSIYEKLGRIPDFPLEPKK